ncbi:Activating signal cointegrator 1 complex subunit-like protein [Hapsidospora chrysogenum ATCC 11550]|uniref:Activating signal cointegrator 1 complex subunit-like protein n=1 Tax=Hapsidospora chrysogenum (strain ATCC 11550 / CBS 779.69 / DSM 880 / IAM 14645 / JCM 23072 / IMI 49137) TaxID=857340 RepID=A0A086TG00_HAPC1|nr:Activating signal cointegrator 1 complex subunit-like protein [Hapsidospora chrysogenum ATCC 11550]
MPPRASPTHFLCIPLAAPQLTRSLASFRADITSQASFSVPEDAVRPPGTLHLTLGVMSLREETMLARAVGLLRELRLREMLERARSSVLPLAPAEGPGDERLSITLRGLQPMHKASQTSVLYAPPADPSGVLRRFCENLRRLFQDAGLMADEQRPLLLHATVVNTIYVKNYKHNVNNNGDNDGDRRGGQQGRRRRQERLTLDARDILGRYDDYVWVEGMPVTRVAICRMGAKKIEGSDGDEAYEVEAEALF